jgi:hypothetical protein
MLVRKHEGKTGVGRPRRRWEDNTKLDILELGRDSVVGFT